MPLRKGLDPRSLWYELRNNRADAKKPSSHATSLDDLEIQREGSATYHKKPSKIFHDLIRWEMHQFGRILAAIRAEKLDAISRGQYDPLVIETISKEDAILSDVKCGDVLRDVKIRPSGYVHPRLRPPSLKEVKEKQENVVRNDSEQVREISHSARSNLHHSHSNEDHWRQRDQHPLHHNRFSSKDKARRSYG